MYMGAMFVMVLSFAYGLAIALVGRQKQKHEKGREKVNKAAMVKRAYHSKQEKKACHGETRRSFSAILFTSH